jgi:alanine racemase
MTDYLLNRSWAQVNLDSIAHNTVILRGHVRKNAEIMGVVKADAYGHGIRQVIPVLASERGHPPCRLHAG